MSRFGAAVTILAVVFLAAGIVWPRWAETLLHGLMASLAVAFVAGRVYRAKLPEALGGDTFTPFDGVSRDTPLPLSPPALEKLTSVLAPVDDPDAARQVPIPGVAHNVLVAEATRRLSEHHGLDATDPNHEGRVRALVSDATWGVIRPDRASGRRLSMDDRVPVHQLAKVLDDVERL